VHSSSEWEKEEKDAFALFSKKFVPLYRVFLENDQDKKFDGGVVRLWGSNIDQIAKTSGVSILKRADNSGEE